MLVLMSERLECSLVVLVFLPNEEHDHYDMVKQEAVEAMEDAASPGANDLPLEYQTVPAATYDKDALLQQVLEASKADEDGRFPDLQ
jgi:hypothetical protein